MRNRYAAIALAWIGMLVVAGCAPRPPTHATLTEAVESDDLADARRHLRLGAAVNEVGLEGWTPLMVAAYRGDCGLIGFLMNHGADVNARNATGATPLMVAIHGNHWKAARNLVDGGADVNAQTRDGQTPLLLAVRKGDERTVHYLLEKNADVTLADRHGNTVWVELASLESRTGLQRPELAQWLEKQGAAH